MSISKIIIAICSLLFLMIGFDKFFSFLDPPCTMMGKFPVAIWKTLGVLQLISAILIWLPKYRKYVVGFFFLFMLGFTIFHLINKTYDIGGSAFMALLLGLLFWSPDYLVKRWKR